MKLPYFKFGSSTTCTYCGEDAESIDHVFCVCSQTMKRKNSDKTAYGPTTHACLDCNNKLGSRQFDSFLERCQFVSDRLAKKARPIMWTQGELNTLAYSLKDYVSREMKKRLYYRFRADWFQSRDFVLNLEVIRFELCLDETSPQYNEQMFRYFQSTISMCSYLSS
jgi:hypothetical protein